LRSARLRKMVAIAEPPPHVRKRLRITGAAASIR
jgi:hypothetical protein